MPTQPPWNPIDDPRDKVLLAGRPTPGIAEIVGASNPRNWEEQTPGGWSGGILIFKGIKLSHFSIRCEMFDDDHWKEWHAIRPLLMRATARTSLGCVHPQLASCGIHALVLEDVYAPLQTADGVWMMELSCIEWRGLKSVGTSNPQGAEDNPVSALQKAIKEQEEQNKRLEEEVKRMAAQGNQSGGFLESIGL